MTVFRRLYSIQLSDEARCEADAAPKKFHSKDGCALSAPRSLEIAKHPATDEYYLFYYDDDGEEQSDTLHDSLEEAFSFAAVEFGIDRKNWVYHGP